MESGDLVRMLRRSWALGAILILLAVSAAAVYSATREPLYRSTAKVFVSTQSAATIGELTQGTALTQQVVASYADIVTTPIVLDGVIDELGLDLTPAALAGKVTAEVARDTVVIDIAVTDPSAASAADIANAVSRQLAAVVTTLAPSGEGGVSPIKITPVQDAVVPASPDSPRTSVDIAVGFMIGLLLAITAALLRERVDTRIRGRADVSRVTDAPILGAIARSAVARKRPLMVLDDPHSPRAEAFRSFRTNLQFLDLGRASRSFVITSSVQAEGKSTTATNLAIAIAETGASVVVIDGDLRRPRLADYLGIEGAVGLTNVLIESATLDEALQPWGDRGLMVLPAGELPPNPTELLQSTAMVSLLAALKKRFGTIIIDAPPLLPVSDAAILSRRTSGAIVVCASGRVTRQQLKESLASIEQVGGKTLGVAITMLPTRGPEASSAGNYGYGAAETRAAALARAELEAARPAEV